MKMTGMVINLSDDDSEMDKINDMIEEIDKITNQYSCGQDDGKFFLVSDDVRVLDILNKTYPKNNFQKLEMSEWPWDYTHISD